MWLICCRMPAARACVYQRAGGLSPGGRLSLAIESIKLIPCDDAALMWMIIERGGHEILWTAAKRPRCHDDLVIVKSLADSDNLELIFGGVMTGHRCRLSLCIYR